MSATRHALIAAGCVAAVWLILPEPISARSPESASCKTPAITGTSNLSIHFHDVDVPRATAVTTLAVPRAWSLADDLLADVESRPFENAVTCVSHNGWDQFASSVSVQIETNTLSLVIRTDVDLKRDSDALPFPWKVSGDDAQLRIDRPSPHAGEDYPDRTSWRLLTVTTDDGRLHDPAPAPAATDGPNYTRWSAPKSFPKVSVDVPNLAQIKLWAASADRGSLSYDSDDVSNMAFAGLLLLLLVLAARRYRPPHGATVVAACAGLLLIYVESLAHDMYSSFLPARWWYTIALGVDTLVLAVLGWIHGRRWLTLPAVPLIGVAVWYGFFGDSSFAGSLPMNLLIMAVLLVGAWLLVDWLAPGIVVVRWARASIIGYVLLKGAEVIYRLAHYDFHRGQLTNLLAVNSSVTVEPLVSIALIGLIMLLMVRCQERVSRCVFATLVAAVAMWQQFGNGFYLGISVPVPAVLVLIIATLALRFSRVPDMDALQSTIYADPQWDELRGDLFLAQTEIAALRRSKPLDEMNVEDFAKDTLVKTRARIRALRSVPPALSSTAEQGTPLPPHIDPVDLVRAHGPKSGAVSAAVRVAIAPAMIATGILLWAVHHHQPLSYLMDWYREPLPNVLEIVDYLIFWLVPVVVLGATWQSFRASGSARGILVWTFIGLPLVIHLGLLKLWDQPGDPYALMRAAALLIILLFTGTVLDTQTLRAADDGTRLASGTFRVVNARPVVTAITTLIIPLVTVGLAIWKQVDTGVGVPSPSPSRTCPAPSQSASSGPNESTSPTQC